MGRTYGCSPRHDPCQKNADVILSEASEFVAAALGRNKKFRSEPKDLRLANLAAQQAPLLYQGTTLLAPFSQTPPKSS
jgi:hypothetical protein